VLPLIFIKFIGQVAIVSRRSREYTCFIQVPLWDYLDLLNEERNRGVNVDGESRPTQLALLSSKLDIQPVSWLLFDLTRAKCRVEEV
jgi:hypothetical protein